MSDKHSHSDEKLQSEVKVTTSFIGTLIGTIVVPVAFLVLIAAIVYNIYATKPVKEDAEVVNQRIKPIGDVAVLDPNAPVVLKSGEEVYKGLCINCHGAGLLGAPKAGDKGVWGKVISQGQQTLFNHALQGIRAMPAKGGNPDLEDTEVQRAVIYMANLAGANWKNSSPTEPAAQQANTVAKASDGSEAPKDSADKKQESQKIDGKKVFESTCVACHGTGVAGAPKAGDKSAWGARIAQGKAVLYTNALKGIRAMPAKGGNASLSDEEVKAAVDHLTSLAQ
ncbi:MAG: c-type cytochrome [Pseudomonadota bacterium]